MMRQIHADELVQTHALLAQIDFDLIPKRKASYLLERWKMQRLEWLLRRWSLLALWKPWRDHFQAWIDVCDLFIAGLSARLVS